MNCSQPLCCLVALLISLCCFVPSALAADIYEDKEAGVSFVIPEGWKEKPLTKEQENYAEIIFIKGSDAICYARTDLWAQASEVEKKIVSRDDIDNSILTEKDIILSFGPGTVTRERFGGVEYFVWEGELPGWSNGVSPTLDTTMLIRVYNGYMYAFFYAAFPQNDDAMNDFLEMVKSIEYAGETKGQQTDSASETAAPSGDVYEDRMVRFSYVVPEGWVKESSFISDFKLVSGSDMIFYDYIADLWEESGADKAMLSRDEVDNTKLSEKDIEGRFGPGTVTRERFGDYEYFVWEGEEPGYRKGVSETQNTIRACRVHNGYLIAIVYQSPEKNDAAGKDFARFLSSVRYEEASSDSLQTGIVLSDKPKTSGYSRTEFPGITADGIILALLLTVTVYSLPIAIYRYGIRKRPMEQEKAKKVTIIYGVIAFIVMFFIIIALGGTPTASGAIFLWSGVNYLMLTRGRNTGGVDDEPAESDEAEGA